MKLHEVTQLFPRMSGAEFKALVADIREHGIRQPVLVTDGKIVDGRNRWEACKKIGIECPTVEWDGKGSLLDAVISLNLKRRHLNQSQRAMIAARVATLKDGQRKSGRSNDLAQPEAAAMLGVSVPSVKRARKVLDSGDEEVIGRVDAGDETVSKAAATVARKAKGNGKADWSRLAELAADGNTSHQIAKKLGVGRDAVVKKAAQVGVKIHADRVVGKSYLPKPNRILREFVEALEALAPSCDLIDTSCVTPDMLRECVPVMVRAMKQLRKLEHRLKEACNG